MNRENDVEGIAGGIVPFDDLSKLLLDLHLSGVDISNCPELLRLMFEYKDGILYWKIDRGANKTKGLPVSKDSTQTKYLNVGLSFYGIRIRLTHSRIIWVICNGEIPNGKLVEHADRNTRNNKISNLRLADYSQNGVNTPPKNRKLKYPFIVRANSIKEAYCAKLSFNGETLNLGTFETQEEAYKVAIAKRKEISGEFFNEKEYDEA